MRYTVDIPGCPVLINDILRTPSRHQSRLKANGRKSRTGGQPKLGYVQLFDYLDMLPSFKVPVHVHVTIYQTRRNPIDVDSVNKTLLDAMKRRNVIVDDNHLGVKSLKVTYAKGFHPMKRVRLSVRE